MIQGPGLSVSGRKACLIVVSYKCVRKYGSMGPSIKHAHILTSLNLPSIHLYSYQELGLIPSDLATLQEKHKKKWGQGSKKAELILLTSMTGYPRAFV